MNKVGPDVGNLTTSPLRLEGLVERLVVIGDFERVPVQQLAESQELDKRASGVFDRLGPGLPRSFKGENQQRTREPGPPASGPVVLRLPLPAHEPAALAEAGAEPQGPAFVNRIDDPRDGGTELPCLPEPPAEAKSYQDPVPAPQRFRKMSIPVSQHDADP